MRLGLTRFRIVIARLERAGGVFLYLEKANILKTFEHASEHSNIYGILHSI